MAVRLAARLQVVVLLNDTPITEYSFSSGVFKTT